MLCVQLSVTFSWIVLLSVPTGLCFIHQWNQTDYFNFMFLGLYSPLSQLSCVLFIIETKLINSILFVLLLCVCYNYNSICYNYFYCNEYRCWYCISSFPFQLIQLFSFYLLYLPSLISRTICNHHLYCNCTITTTCYNWCYYYCCCCTTWNNCLSPQ